MDDEWKIFAVVFGLMFLFLIGSAVAHEINKGRIADCIAAKAMTPEECKKLFES